VDDVDDERVTVDCELREALELREASLDERLVEVGVELDDERLTVERPVELWRTPLSERRALLLS
jgi:hypothetical protein